MTIVLCLALAASALPVPAAAQEPLPLPRFVTLKANEVNLRAGPGESYPVEWVYTRRGLPVEIVAEYDQWRRVRDVEGTMGWVHQVMLSGQRNVIVTGATVRTAYGQPSADARAVFRAEPGVQGKLLLCEPGWCRIEVGSARGWMPMADLWGVYPEDGTGG